MKPVHCSSYIDEKKLWQSISITSDCSRRSSSREDSRGPQRSLHLSQPAISKSLNELERQLDVNLLDRTGRSIRLTAAGRTLYERARELFGVESAAERELRELRGLKRGTLRIAASTTIATYLLPPYLGRFHLRHPNVRIQTTSANTRAVLRMLLEFRADVALVEGPVANQRVVVNHGAMMS